METRADVQLTQVSRKPDTRNKRRNCSFGAAEEKKGKERKGKERSKKKGKEAANGMF